MKKDPVLEKDENKEEIKWHPKLTQEQIDELISECIKPGDQEYDSFLWNYGINPFEKTNESDVEEVEIEAIKWHPKLTQEQIEELIAEGIKPGDQEYDSFLWNYGINPFEKIEESKIEEIEIKDNNNNIEKNDIKDNNNGSKEIEESEIKNEEDEIEEEPKEEQRNDNIKRISRIIVNPEESEIEYEYYLDNKDDVWRGSQETPFKYEENQIDAVNGLLENMLKKDIKCISGAIDPNIVQFASENKDKFNIDEYLNLLKGKESSVDLIYDFRGIYDSNLDLKTIKNMMKIARAAQKSSKGSIDIVKDPLFKRIAGNIKKRISSLNIKLLNSGKAEKIEEVKETKVEEVKESKEKTSLLRRFTSKKLPRTPELFKNVKEELAVAGIKIKGFLKGEPKVVTDIKENNMRESFVKKVTVDENAAMKKVEESKQKDPEEKEAEIK